MLELSVKKFLDDSSINTSDEFKEGVVFCERVCKSVCVLVATD
jgi:hypothetical protein